MIEKSKCWRKIVLFFILIKSFEFLIRVNVMYENIYLYFVKYFSWHELLIVTLFNKIIHSEKN